HVHPRAAQPNRRGQCHERCRRSRRGGLPTGAASPGCRSGTTSRGKGQTRRGESEARRQGEGRESSRQIQGEEGEEGAGARRADGRGTAGAGRATRGRGEGQDTMIDWLAFLIVLVVTVIASLAIISVVGLGIRLLAMPSRPGP